MWVTPNNLYVLAAQNAIVDRNSVKLGGFTDTLLGYSFLKNQPDSMRDNRDTSCKARATEKMGVQVTPDTLLFKLLRAKNNANAASKTFKPIVQYILCSFV